MLVKPYTIICQQKKLSRIEFRIETQAKRNRKNPETGKKEKGRKRKKEKFCD